MALTEDLTFKLGNDGVVLNANSSVAPFIDVDEVDGLDSAPFRETKRDWEGNDGGFMDAEFEKGRSIIIGGTIYGDVDTLETYLDSLKANWAPSRVLVPFYFKAPGVAERVLFVKPGGVRYRWQTIRRTGRVDVQFSMFAEDPRIYTATLTTLAVPVGGTATSGFGFSLGFSFGFGTITGSLGVNAVVSGNRPTPPLFTIYGPVANPRIYNDTTGEMLQFSITLGSGETLVVDPKYKTVRLGGVTNRRSALVNPTWFFLEPGDNFLRYLTESGGSTMDVAYRDAWR